MLKIREVCISNHTHQKFADMMERHRANNLFERPKTLIAHSGMTWALFKNSLKDMKQFDIINAVNRVWNSRKWKSDKENWRKADYWATPLEFAMKGGDCEDYAIAKMLSLQELGLNVPMRLIGSRDHMLLYVDGLILDNRTYEILKEFPKDFSPLVSITTDTVYLCREEKNEFHTV